MAALSKQVQTIQQCRELTAKCIELLDELSCTYRHSSNRLYCAAYDGTVPPEEFRKLLYNFPTDQVLVLDGCSHSIYYDATLVGCFSREYRAFLHDIQACLDQVDSVLNCQFSERDILQSIENSKQVMGHWIALEQTYSKNLWHSLMLPEKILGFWISQRFPNGVLNEYFNTQLQAIAGELRQESSALCHLFWGLNDDLCKFQRFIDNSTIVVERLLGE